MSALSMLCRSGGILGLALVVPSGLGHAQAPAASSPPDAVCRTGHPAPACRAFWITEAFYSYVIGGRLVEHQGGMEVGLMRNVGTRSALGGTLFVAVSDLHCSRNYCD